MNSNDTIKYLKSMLSEQIALYEKYLEKEKNGEVDSSYIYDTACEWIGELDRGSCASLLASLSEAEVQDE